MALRWGHQEADGEHLLGLLEQSEGLIPRILQKMNVPVDALKGCGAELENVREFRAGIGAGEDLYFSPCFSNSCTGAGTGRAIER